MTEWGVFGIVAALVSFVSIFATAAFKLAAAMTRLSVALDKHQEQYALDQKRNSESHDRLWKKEDEQDKKLENHEIRIIHLEEEK